MKNKTIITALAGVVILSGVAFQSSTHTRADATSGAAVHRDAAVTSLTGAGSTFDFPFFNKAFYVYGEQKHVMVNYSSIGSGGGIQQFTANTVNFGASDVPMNATEVKKAEATGGPVIQIPIALGGEAISYNLPGVKTRLKFTPEVIADIYLGKIKNWDAPQLKAINKGVKLPNQPIVVVHRSDGSGTTYIFTDFLSTISPQWAKQVGRGKSVNWPVGIGGKGNEAVAENVRNTVGSIGYVELAYVLQTKMSYGYVKNRDGEYLLPSPATVAVAASKKPGVTSTNFSIVWEPGANSYPISGYSWVLLHQKQPNLATKNAIVNLFNWMEGPGQAEAASVDYVPLPANVRAQAHRLLSEVK